MRERIAAAISILIKKDPTDVRLIKQQMLLADAKICTIDSFCSSVVKENFELLDISSDFRTADAGELAVIKKEALTLTVEKMYESGSDDFRRLIEMLFSGADDSEIEDAIDKLYEVSRSYAFPERWLSELSDIYAADCEIKESVHGKIVLERVKQGVEYSLSVFRRLLDGIEGDETLEKIYHKNDAINQDIAQCEHILCRTIAFGMDACIIKNFFTIGNAHKACALQKGLFA
jgi:ATP-dependent helicase/nuclease subunit A